MIEIEFTVREIKLLRGALDMAMMDLLDEDVVTCDEFDVLMDKLAVHSEETQDK